jgi:hypothetical protein
LSKAPEPGHVGTVDGPAELAVGYRAAGGEDVHAGEHLAGHLGPQRGQTVQLPGQAQRPLQYRIGQRAGAHLVQRVPVIVECGAGHGGPQADLGGHRSAHAS